MLIGVHGDEDTCDFAPSRFKVINPCKCYGQETCGEIEIMKSACVCYEDKAIADTGKPLPS